MIGRQAHGIELALDLARMPSLARADVQAPIPANILEIIGIAAENEQACESAAVLTGEPIAILVESARFYLQYLLFRPDADCYRILGVRPGASKATARTHMRLLMKWLHPDRNDGIYAVYAQRVMRAWREFAGAENAVVPLEQSATARANFYGGRSSRRVPWIKIPKQERKKTHRRFWLSFSAVLVVLAALAYCWGPQLLTDEDVLTHWDNLRATQR
jgi:hypothetical protein